jgi:hypothetical protein
MSTITLARELVKIIKSGDLDYATDYYNEWCKDAQWSRFEATEIILACRLFDVDPLRFNAQVEKLGGSIKAEDRITYDDVFGNEE